MEIVTPRLVVRPFRASDLDGFLAYQGLPEVRRYLRGEPMDEEEAVRFLAGQAALRGDERGKWHGFAVEQIADGKMIGDVGVFLQKEVDEGDVGFQFHPAYHGQGFAQKAVRGLLGHLFESSERVTAHCDARNVASWRLMERLGMRRVSESGEGFGYALGRDESV